MKLPDCDEWDFVVGFFNYLVLGFIVFALASPLLDSLGLL